MLHNPPPAIDPRVASGVVRSEDDSELLDLEQLLAAARRQYRIVLVCMAVCLGLGLLYLSQATQLFAASIRITIDQNAAAVVNRLSQVSNSAQNDELIASEIELIRSERIGLAVVDSLDLANDQAFLRGEPSLVGASFRWIASVIGSILPSSETKVSETDSGSGATKNSGASPPDSEARRRRAARILTSGLTVSRVGKSYVLEVSYESSDPVRAAAVADAYAEAYVDDSLQSKYEALHRASSWLLERIEELRSRSAEADLAVQQYRAEHNAIVESDNADETALSRSRLRKLESEATSYRSLYQSFLQKYQESIQQQSFPITDARIINEAFTPSSPTSPRKVLVLGLAIILGGAVGAGVGAYREFRDKSLKTAEHVRSYLRLEPLGMLPKIKGRRWGRRADSLLSFVATHPSSAFTESIRATKLAIDLALPGKKSKVIGIVSTLSGEGKSTVAANLSMLLAAQGTRTLLIDADLQHSNLTRAMTRDAQHGLIDVLRGTLPAEAALCWAATEGFAVLPGVLDDNSSSPHSGHLLASSQMASVLEAQGSAFEYVIVDLPPLAEVHDARAFAAHADAFVLVAEWGQTSGRIINAALQSERQIYDKCVGVLLNKAKINKLKLYDQGISRGYYNSKYRR